MAFGRGVRIPPARRFAASSPAPGGQRATGPAGGASLHGSHARAWSAAAAVAVFPFKKKPRALGKDVGLLRRKHSALWMCHACEPLSLDTASQGSCRALDNDGCCLLGVTNGTRFLVSRSLPYMCEETSLCRLNLD